VERKIVIGYDPSNNGGDALQLGRLLVEVTGARSLVVTVIPWPTYILPPTDLERLVEVETREDFAMVRDRLGDTDVDTRALSCQSPPAALSKLAEDERASVLVLGSSHRGTIGRTFLGGVGESLIHAGPCAVAVAPRDYGLDEGRSLLKIGAAFDGSPESWSSLETAIGIAERTGGTLTVLTVADYPHYGYAATWSVMTAGRLQDAERDQKQRLLELAVNRAPARLSAEGRLLTGPAGKLLASVSGEFDLMVAGSRGHGPLRRTLLGSATRRLLRDSGCPVLILPRGVGVDPLELRRHARSGLKTKAAG
jgi:nucleotide-binding universal stress UspA family protein